MLGHSMVSFNRGNVGYLAVIFSYVVYCNS